MGVTLKPLEHQVVVITGATSGIGLATAREAAKRGARLVLAARNAEALEKVVSEIESRGGRAVSVVADVGERADVDRIAEAAVSRFGGFDTWVNNAGVTIYGPVTDVPVEDQKRLFETNYWGVVNGSLVAARHLRRRGGAIINIGSVLSDRALILQGAYSASKHAVKGFTDALRMELEHQRAPVSVTLVKPSAIATPYAEHARNLLDAPSPSFPPPVYDPRLAARGILFAAEHPRRTMVIGAGGYAISVLGNMFPRMTDYVMEAVMPAQQRTNYPGRPGRRDNLYEPREDYAERGSLPELEARRRSSMFLEAQMHPLAAFGLAAGLGLAVAAMVGLTAASRRPRERRAFAGRTRRMGERRGGMTRWRGDGPAEETLGPGTYPTRAQEQGQDQRARAH